MMFRSGKQLTFIVVSLFLVVLAAAQTASAQSISVELAERTPSADPSDLLGPPPTTTTTITTTTTLPTIPRCPDSLVDATTGSNSGYGYWRLVDEQACAQDPFVGRLNAMYCFQNPNVNQQLPSLQDKAAVVGFLPLDSTMFWDSGELAYEGDWQVFAARMEGVAYQYPQDCFLCACFREIGCFAPGVKIAMADGSLRNIEDVRAGDSVRNARSGTAVKVRRVIEGPETAQLIRFGFAGTTVTTSQAHPVLTAAGLKPANELKRGDLIFDGQGHPHTLTILETLPLEEGQRVINLDLDVASSDANERLMVSDGIVTGDIVLQGLLKERRST